MKLNININGIGVGIGIIAIITGLLLSAVPASASGYVKLGDIKGEALSADSQRLIDEYNELAPQVNEHMGELIAMADKLRGEETAAVEYEKSTPKLQEAVAQLKDELAGARDLVSQIADSQKPASGSTGQSRRRGSAVLEDLSIAAQCNQQAAAIEEAVTIVGEIGTEFNASLR